MLDGCDILRDGRCFVVAGSLIRESGLVTKNAHGQSLWSDLLGIGIVVRYRFNEIDLARFLMTKAAESKQRFRTID
jgi:hypothetical protein